MKRLACFAIFFLTAPTFAMEKKVKVIFSKEDNAITFKTSISEGFKVSNEERWQLKIKSSEGIDFAPKQQELKGLDNAIPGFRIAPKSIAKTGKVSFVMHAYICTVKKGQCFLEKIDQENSW